IMGAVEFHLAQGDSWQALSKTLKNSMALTRSRAQMVARTEMGAAMAEGTKLRYEREGIEYVQFISTRSSATCSYCAWRHGNVYERATVIIKLHPNCRCTVVPWKPEWEEKGLTDPQADAKQRKAILEELEKSGKKPNYGPAPFERSVGLEKPQKPFWEPPPWKGPNVNRNKPYKGLSIGNPERSTTGELFKVSPPITISATGNTSYVAGVPGINQAIVNGRALLSSSVSPAQGKALQTQAASFVTQLKAKEAAVLQVVKGDAAGKVKALAAQKSGMKVLEEMAPGLDKAYKAALETPLSAKQVKGFVDGVEIVGATAVETKAIRSNLDEFARLFNGAGLTKARKLRVDRIVLTKGDPTDFSVYSFDPAKKQVSMPTGFMKMSGNGKKALFHEMAHAIEASQPKMVLRQEAWIKSRSPYSGPALMDAGYGPNDLMDAYPDKFVNSYVGTVYESNNIPGKGMDKMGEVFDDYDRATRGVERKWKYTPQATESISVGVEYFVDPIARAELWARDPDHFNLILSLTREILE
ncbi:MAG: minor capsid protein, partial [Prochlorococcaceae cyanobacterium ETNP18_MAG_17]|nr:minor capsid protein [Prochlorococcaceae cyanobacterium ETNP18_MAG_17]